MHYFSIFSTLRHLKSIEPFFEATQFDKHQADYLTAGGGSEPFSNHIYSLTSFVTICFIPSVIHQRYVWWYYSTMRWAAPHNGIMADMICAKKLCTEFVHLIGKLLQWWWWILQISQTNHMIEKFIWKNFFRGFIFSYFMLL